MRVWLILIACGSMLTALTNAAQASLIISGNHTVAGRPVELSGLEWLAWNDPRAGFISASSVAAKFGPGGELEGWRYATRTEFESLFDSLWGGTHEGEHPSNYAGAKWLQDHFVVRAAPSRFNVAFGLGDFRPDHVDRGVFYVQTTDPQLGYFTNHEGLSVGTGSDNIQNLVFMKVPAFDGHALVRSTSSASSTATAPEPGSLAVMGIGVLGMIAGGRRRRRTAKGITPMPATI